MYNDGLANFSWSATSTVFCAFLTATPYRWALSMSLAVSPKSMLSPSAPTNAVYPRNISSELIAIAPTVSMRSGRYIPPSMITLIPGVSNSNASREELAMIARSRLCLRWAAIAKHVVPESRKILSPSATISAASSPTILLASTFRMALARKENSAFRRTVAPPYTRSILCSSAS
ncbi:MAG: hypothetical protein NT031_10080, partial [Planctomycetota bacterium]|nr:hypothetical protein [Planctomycetota bacterium]